MDNQNSQEDLQLNIEPDSLAGPEQVIATVEPSSPTNTTTNAAAESKPAVVEASPADFKTASGIGRRGAAPVKTARPVAAVSAKRRSDGIGRGGVSAIVLLLVFLPLVGFLAYFWLSTSSSVSSLQYTLKNFQASANSGIESDFAALISTPNLQVLHFKNEDGGTDGQVILFNGGRLKWAFSYGRLAPLTQGQMYVMWLGSKSDNGAAPTYSAFLTLPDVRTGGALRVMNDTDFPASFQASFYSELIITVESASQPVSAPNGIRLFSLDLSQVKDFS